MLTKRKGNDLDTAMKRPASKKTLAKAEPKQKAIVKKNAEEAKHVTPAFLIPHRNLWMCQMPWQCE